MALNPFATRLVDIGFENTGAILPDLKGSVNTEFYTCSRTSQMFLV
jgi:hypothetical protein